MDLTSLLVEGGATALIVAAVLDVRYKVGELRSMVARNNERLDMHGERLSFLEGAREGRDRGRGHNGD